MSKKKCKCKSKFVKSKIIASYIKDKCKELREKVEQPIYVYSIVDLERCPKCYKKVKRSDMETGDEFGGYIFKCSNCGFRHTN